MQEQKKIEVPSYLKVSKFVIWFLYFYILLGIISLIFRVFLLLASADSTAGFYQLITNISSDYLQPFRGIFPAKPVGEAGYLDVSALFAILVYLFLLWGVHSLISYVQNKIDINQATQEKELAEIKRQKELAALRASKTTDRPAAPRRPA